MKVFKFWVSEYFYAYSGETEEQAKELFEEEQGVMPDRVEEIPESEWDEKIISMWKETDLETEPFEVSIREVLTEYPCMIFTNDNGLL